MATRKGTKIGTESIGRFLRDRLSAGYSYALAVDPGDKTSAYVLFREWTDYDGREVRGDGSTPFMVHSFDRIPNRELRQMLASVDPLVRRDTLLITEMLRARGMPTSNNEFETCVQIGMMLRTWMPGRWSYAFRGDIKLLLCGNSRAKDPNVRAALIDLWGGKQNAIGGKKCGYCKGKGWVGRGRPTCHACTGTGVEFRRGPLYGMAEDEWAALAVAYWWHAEGEIQHVIPPPKTKRNKSKKKPRKSILARKGKKHA